MSRGRRSVLDMRVEEASGGCYLDTTERYRDGQIRTFYQQQNLNAIWMSSDNSSRYYNERTR